MPACRLPVASAAAPTDGNNSHGTTGTGGFVQFPAGTFSVDPQSSGTYDLAAHKWLPVPHAWVSPDGTRYAYPEYRSAAGPATGVIHVVDVASGADHPLNVPAPSAPVSWETSGLYIARVVPNSDAPPQGLSRLDPASGALKQITPDGIWSQVGVDSAYGTDLDTSIQAPPNAGPGAGNRLRSLRLDTGAVTVVQTFPGQQATLLALQGSTPVLIVTATGTTQVRAGPATLYNQSAATPGPMPPADVDGSTLWLSGTDGVWHSLSGGPLQRTAVPLQAALVAGACR